MKALSHVQLFVTQWTAAYQAPPPMGFSRQEYWSGVPLPSLKITLVLLINSDNIIEHQDLAIPEANNPPDFAVS